MAIGLFIAELFTQGIGILAAGGLTAFVLGSLMLYTPLTPVSPAVPHVQVNLWLVGGLALFTAAFFLFVIRALLRAHQAPVATGTQALIGRAGLAATDLAPEGAVRVDSETWRAVTEKDTIRAGEWVEVVGVEGVTLHVRKRAS